MHPKCGRHTGWSDLGRAPLSVGLSVALSRLIEFGLVRACTFPHAIQPTHSMASSVSVSHKKQRMSSNSNHRYPSRTRTKTAIFLEDIQEEAAVTPGKPSRGGRASATKLPPKKSTGKKNARKKRRTKKTNPEELPPPQSPEFVISKVVGETPDNSGVDKKLAGGGMNDAVVLVPAASSDAEKRFETALKEATQWHLILGDANGATTLMIGRNYQGTGKKVSIGEIVETLRQTESSHNPRIDKTVNNNGKLNVDSLQLK